MRGVESSSIVNSLVEKDLLEEAGRLDVPGRPIAYKTTNTFLRCFDMSIIEELPPLPSHSEQVSFNDRITSYNVCYTKLLREKEKKSYLLKFKGSSNQRIIDCKKSLENVAIYEVEF